MVHLLAARQHTDAGNYQQVDLFHWDEMFIFAFKNRINLSKYQTNG
jgi:hypothetical protein